MALLILECAQQMIPNGQEQSEVYIANAGLLAMMKAVHLVGRQQVFKQSQANVGIGISQDVKMLREILSTTPAMDCIHAAAIKSALLGLSANGRRVPASIDERAEQVMAYIQEHLARKLSAERLAEEVALSADYLMTSFRKHVGLSIRQYVL